MANSNGLCGYIRDDAQKQHKECKNLNAIFIGKNSNKQYKTYQKRALKGSGVNNLQRVEFTD